MLPIRSESASSRGKPASVARILAPNPTRRPFALYSNSILLLWCRCNQTRTLTVKYNINVCMPNFLLLKWQCRHEIFGNFSPMNPTHLGSDKQAEMVLLKDSFSRRYSRNKWLRAVSFTDNGFNLVKTFDCESDKIYNFEIEYLEETKIK